MQPESSINLLTISFIRSCSILCFSLLEAIATGCENRIHHHMPFIQQNSEGFFHSSVLILHPALYFFEEYSTTYLKCKLNFASNAL